MDSISYRKWEIWANTTLFEEHDSFRGYYECILTPTLMTPQTLEFLYENYELRLGQNLELVAIVRPSKEIIQMQMLNQFNELCLRIYGTYQYKDSIQEKVFLILKLLSELSMRLDITLNCNKITFVDHTLGNVFQAVRRNIGRGMSFEVEERMLAKKKLMSEFHPEKKTSPAVKAYLTGMNLLGLEDQFPGLLEAAFMQFYCGCEFACNVSDCEAVKHYIADTFTDENDAKALQIIAHHVWQVRNKYFGHGVKEERRAPDNYEQANRVARQVLVARYLCKRLIEPESNTKEVLIRGVNFFFDGISEGYGGDVSQLSSDFYVPYNGRNVKIYTKNEKNPVESYMICCKEEK